MPSLEQSLLIESIGFGGAGVGRLPDGRVCFVPFTLPGERANVRIVREKKSFTEAEVVRLNESAIGRIPPRCAIFGKCGGCAYQHITYSKQLELKHGQVRDLLRRIGGLADVEVRPMLGSPSEWEYRNRISVHVEDGVVGFYGRKSHRIVPATACPIATPGVSSQLAELAGDPPRGTHRITLREPSEYHGFSQVNHGAAKVLAEAVASMLEQAFENSAEPELEAERANPARLLVDAYCGAGFFSKKLAPRFEKVIGIEWSAGAVRAAKSNAPANATYQAGAVEAHLAGVLASHPSAQTALLLDPPAEGLSAEVIDIVLSARPAAVVLVACDPATLARDLKRLGKAYAVRYVQPVDMFPQTAEIEATALCYLL
jgi:23S rRNA (uracil1939-C5)-methyltransferase